jgi:predicted ATPase/DNA-binding XRE family transcriptional regulator
LLRRFRGARGMTQQDLAERAGLNTYAISMLERGVRRTPRSTTVEFLAEALKLNSSERRALHAAARGSRVSAAPRPAARPLAIPPELQAPSLALIGRERELTRAAEMLARPSVRLLTLTGAPGSGKTRLALELARDLTDRYEDGVVVVALGPLGDPGLVMPSIRRELGLEEAGSEASLDTVARHCRDRRLLLVLDNFEHVLSAGSELVMLLGRCPGVQALVTSRALLRIRSEWELAVPPLALPTSDEEAAGTPEALAEVASVRLFLERSEMVLPSFRLSAENAGAVSAICRRLDGLPLALELAAPWLRVLAPGHLLTRLNQRLELLVDGPRDLPGRQRTLRAALDWSCELLDEEPLALFRRLSVFAGGAPLEAVERVCQAAAPLRGGLLQNLAVLVEHSLVQRQETADGGPRVMMLESVREYASELLVDAGESDATGLAHMEFYLDLATRARREIRGAAQASWLNRLRREHDNIRAALVWAVDHGHSEDGLRMAAGLRQFWDYGGQRQEGFEWLEQLLAAGGPLPPAVRADGLYAVGVLAAQLGFYELAAARHQDGLAIFKELDDSAGVADTLCGMAEALRHQGDNDQAMRLFEEAVSLLRRIEDRPRLATQLIYLGIHASNRGDLARGMVLYEEALAISRSIGDELLTALCLVNLADTALLSGRLDLAATYLSEAVTIARRLDAPFHLGAALANLGDLERTRGDTRAAAARYRESLRLFAGIGHLRGVAVSLRFLGWVAWTRGQAIRATELYGAANGLCPNSSNVGTDMQIHEEACAAIRQHLGDRRFEVAYAAGGRLSLEEALALASASF